MAITLRHKVLLLTLLLIVLAACSEARKITPADRRYLFLPAEIDHNPFAGYEQKKAWDHLPYILFTKREEEGFLSIYVTILKSHEGKEVHFLSMVDVLPTADEAKKVYDRMIPEPDPRQFGQELTVSPGLYDAEDVYLYVSDTGYFHLVVWSARTVYSILVDGATVDESQIRKNLRQKLDYIRRNGQLFR